MNEWCRRTARCVLFVFYLFLSLMQKMKILAKNRSSIVFVLDQERLYSFDDGMGRYAYLILNSFSESGYNVYLYKDVQTFAKFMALGKYGRLIYSIKNLKLITHIPRFLQLNKVFYAFDSINVPLMQEQWKKRIYINILRPSFCRIGDVLWRPYYFHPMAYRGGLDKRIGNLRSNERKIKVVFAGNAIPEWYSTSKLKERYNQLTRNEGVSAAMELSEHTEEVKNLCQFMNNVYNGPYLNKCCLLLTDRQRKLRPGKYWDLISKSDFFLCLSGTDLPQCHHSIESMSVGTIPIIAYPEWFFPALEHGKNAVVYSDKESLKARILDVLAMDKKEILRMRKNVIEYYEKYLTNRRMIESIENDTEDYVSIMQHPRLVCDENENDAGKEFMNRLMDFVQNSNSKRPGHESGSAQSKSSCSQCHHPGL